MSAVSTKLMPASSARWMMRIESSWSVLPQAPNIIVPRQSFETWTPVRPSGRYSMGVLSLRSEVGRLPRGAALADHQWRTLWWCFTGGWLPTLRDAARMLSVDVEVPLYSEAPVAEIRDPTRRLSPSCPPPGTDPAHDGRPAADQASRGPNHNTPQPAPQEKACDVVRHTGH